MELMTAPSEQGEADGLPLRPLSHHLALTVYWLGNTLLWGALLHLALQSRLSDWFAEEQVGYYIGILGFAGGIVGAVTQIVAGAFSDRSLHPWGRRRPFILAGSLLTVCALMLLAATRSFWPFAGALVLVQLFTNVALSPFTALLPDTVNPREHGKASGFMGVARLLGDTGGLILASILLTTAALPDPTPARVTAFHDHQMAILLMVTAGLILGATAFTCIVIRERPLTRRPERTLAQTVLGSFAVDVRGNPDFFWLTLSRAITNLGFYMFLEVLFFFLKYSLNLKDAEQASMWVMIPAIGIAAAVSIPAGIWSDRVGRRRLVFVSQFLLAGAAAWFVFCGNLTTAIIAGIPAGVAFGIFTAVEWALACNLLPRGEAARYLGVWNASAVVPQILAFPIAGALGSAVSSITPGLGWRLDFALSAFFCLVGAIFLRFVHERRAGVPQPDEETAPAAL